jgi:hypothetical protein
MVMMARNKYLTFCLSSCEENHLLKSLIKCFPIVLTYDPLYGFRFISSFRFFLPVSAMLPDEDLHLSFHCTNYEALMDLIAHKGIYN